MIIGLSGYARSGKDTVADFLKEYGFRRVAFADPMRAAMYTLNPIVSGEVRLQEIVDQIGWDGAKTAYPEIRRLLQVFGTEVGRDQWGDLFWIDRALNGESVFDDIVVTDVRFPNEFEAIKKVGGEVWRIERPGVGPVNSHSSDNALDGFDFDLTLLNDGTLEDLTMKIEGCLR